MIPVEKIAGSQVGNMLYYISVIGLLLVIATIIRLKVPLLRKAFIPASLLAGLIGLALGPYALKVIPADMMSSIGALPGHMITIVFSCMLLGVKQEEKDKTMMRDVAAGLGWLYSCSFMQVGVPALLCALFLTDINPLFASLTEIGFAGGHGTAGGMAAVFDELGWPDGASLGSTMATIGLLIGIFTGMIIINYGVRKKYTQVITENTAAKKEKEVFSQGERLSSSYATISYDVVEPFAFHLGIVGISILVGRLIVYVFGLATGYTKLPLFPFAMIAGYLINIIARHTLLKDMFDRQTFQRIQGMALEILIVAAMASIKIPIVIEYIIPILLCCAVVTALMLFWFFYLSPRIFSESWFEQGIIRYGAFCGVAAVGYMLLRTIDPKMETRAGSIYALGCPLMSPFIGGGLITSMWPALILNMGLIPFGLLTCAVSVAILVALRIFLWNKNPKKTMH